MSSLVLLKGLVQGLLWGREVEVLKGKKTREEEMRRKVTALGFRRQRLKGKEEERESGRERGR